jgi:hypothetical protein
MMVFVSPVKAGEEETETPTPTETPASALWPEMQSLYDQIQELKEQMNAAPTPRPPQPTQVPAVYAPLIKLFSPQNITMGQDETVNQIVTIKNIGTSVANSVLVQAQPAAESPFTVEIMDDTQNMGAINENNSKEMRIRIVTDKDAKPGAYPINLKYFYKDRNQENKSSEDTILVRVTGEEEKPELAAITMSNFSASRQWIMPGDSFTLTADIENVGKGEARSLLVTTETSNPESLYVISETYSSFFTNMESGHKSELSYVFDTSELARGTYTITFKASYTDEENVKQEVVIGRYPVNMATPPDATRATVEIQEMSAPAGEIGVDESALFTFQVFNNGPEDAKNVKVTASDYDTAAVVPKSTNVQLINALPAGTGRLLSYTFAPTAGAKTQSYTVKFTVEYETGQKADDGTVVKDTFEQYASFSAYNPEEEEEKTTEDDGKSNKPKMIVSAYSIDPTIVSAGREFDMLLTFQNANSEKSVKNIKITLEAVEYTEGKGAVFTPVSGSNTLYIDEMPPKGEESRTLRMFAVPDADPRTYNIKVNFGYQDEEYNDYTESEQISIPVKQITRLELSELYLEPTYNMGDQVYLSINVNNTGRVNLYNLRMAIEGNYDVSQADYFIGNLARGNSASWEGIIIPLEAGPQEGTLVVSGEDDAGEVVEYRREFGFEVLEMNFEEGMGGDMMGMDIPGMEMQPGMEGGGEQPQGFFAQALSFVKRPYVWGPAAGVVVVVIVAAVVLARRKKNRVDFDE